MYGYIHKYIHEYMPTYVHTYLPIYIPIYLHTYMHTSIGWLLTAIFFIYLYWYWHIILNNSGSLVLDTLPLSILLYFIIIIIIILSLHVLSMKILQSDLIFISCAAHGIFWRPILSHVSLSARKWNRSKNRSWKSNRMNNVV